MFAKNWLIKNIFFPVYHNDSKFTFTAMVFYMNLNIHYLILSDQLVLILAIFKLESIEMV